MLRVHVLLVFLSVLSDLYNCTNAVAFGCKEHGIL